MKPKYLVLSVQLIVFLQYCGSIAFAQDEQLEHYKKIWADVRPKIQSGIIHHKQVSGGNFKIREHDKVRSLFHELSKDREDYSAIIREFACKLSGVDVPANAPEYPELVLYFKGDRLRIERYGGIEIFNDGLFTEARHVKVNDQSMQINISDKTARVRTLMEGFWDFYKVPSADMTGKMLVASGQSDTDRLEISRNTTFLNGATMIVGKTNGDIREIRTGDPKGTSSEHLYSAFKEFDGVRLPLLVFNAKYIDGTLASASVLTIVDASFSVQIDDSIFVQDAKAGDVIVDSRNGGQRVYRTNHNIEDVTKDIP